jgi:hypothetical protein
MRSTSYVHFGDDKSYLEIPDNPDFSLPTTGKLTVSAWIRPSRLNFIHTEDPDDADRRYVHWMGKGDRGGTNGNHEWVFRMYSKNSTK